MPPPMQHNSALTRDQNQDNPITITLPQDQYAQLCWLAQCYANLVSNLLQGGVDDDTVQLLSTNAAPVQDSGLVPERFVSAQSRSRETNTAFLKPQPQGRGTTPTRRETKLSPSKTQEALDVNLPARPASTASSTPAVQNITQQTTRDVAPYPKFADRTIQLSNLPEGCEYADITSVVRGGQLVEIFLRSKERKAMVSFVREEEASAFLDYVLKHDLYIKQKRVDIHWHDRQHTLPSHVANKLASGVTRNLILRDCPPCHTEESIREDLDHIHNLVVIKVSYTGGDCHISTNSAANAMFARTCMQSRLKYKGLRIEYTPDECSQPLSHIPHPRATSTLNEVMRKPPRNMDPTVNRFEMLEVNEGA